MFTGLVRDVGRIIAFNRNTQSARVSVETRLPVSDLSIGASVACNGACLTVISVESQSSGTHVFEVEIGPQTLALTRFGMTNFAGVSERVNIEPALRMGDALGGHQVTGHVDTLAEVLLIESSYEGFWKLRLKVEDMFSNYVFKKGSISVAGVSLTIADCSRDEKWIEIMLIPHTISETNLRFLRSGDLVEIEFDSQAKMVAELLGVMLPIQLKSLIQKN